MSQPSNSLYGNNKGDEEISSISSISNNENSSQNLDKTNHSIDPYTFSLSSSSIINQSFLYFSKDSNLQRKQQIKEVNLV